MSAPPRAGRGDAARWLVPAAALGCEYLSLSLLVDFPTRGPAEPFVAALRLAVPVILAAAAAGWLLVAHAPGLPRVGAPPLPRWRPAPFLAAHLAAFAITALHAWRFFRPGAPPVSGAALGQWVVWVGLTVLLAARSAVPFGWLIRHVVSRWQVPLLAIAAGALTWRTAAAAEGAWGLFSGLTLRMVHALLRPLSGTVTLDLAARVVGADGFTVQVAPVCSGVDGLGMVFLFQALWIATARSQLRVARALWLFPLGFLAAAAANVVRIAALVRVGAAGHDQLAMGGLHSKLGWLLFLAIALASVAAAQRIGWLQRDGAGREAGRTALPQAAAAYVAPLLATLTAALVAGAFSTGYDRWYLARVAAGVGALALVRRSLPRLLVAPSAAPVLLGVGTAILWIAATRPGGAPLAGALDALGAPARAAWIAVRVVGSCAVIPVVEELAFRGFLLPWLSAQDFERAPPRATTAVALLVSSAAFGLIHERWLVATVAGLAFAAARILRGRLGDAILAHAVANAGVAVAVLLGGRWDLWS